MARTKTTGTPAMAGVPADSPVALGDDAPPASKDGGDY